MQDIGHDVIPLDTNDGIDRGRLMRRVSSKLFRMGLDRLGTIFSRGSRVNGRIRELVSQRAIDAIWIDKGLDIEPSTLRHVKRVNPSCVRVGYSPDDMGVRHGQSKLFLEGLPLYDLFLTTKSYNVPELRALGCPRVVFMGNAFDPHTHKPQQLTSLERERFGGALGFIGTGESERAQQLQRLAREGIPVRVWGTGWRRLNRKHPNLILEEKVLWGDEYAKAISAFDINLSFLRKVNRDLQTTRSIEIPACAKFMLAERTDEHLELFEEGKEAEFFEGDEELLAKLKFYLQRPSLAEKIGIQGRVRCDRSGYSNHERLKSAFRQIDSVRADLA